MDAPISDEHFWDAVSVSIAPRPSQHTVEAVRTFVNNASPSRQTAIDAVRGIFENEPVFDWDTFNFTPGEEEAEDDISTMYELLFHVAVARPSLMSRVMDFLEAIWAIDDWGELEREATKKWWWTQYADRARCK
jgi:hypothetical protein